MATATVNVCPDVERHGCIAECALENLNIAFGSWNRRGGVASEDVVEVHWVLRRESRTNVEVRLGAVGIALEEWGSKRAGDEGGCDEELHGG